MYKWLILGLALAMPTQRIPEGQHENRVYLEHCNSAWYISTQGSDDGADWVALACTDYDSE